ncbi:hypothetical protein [Microbulbifer variabilis]|uniref:hypothetical protein n=1 Tax=Microbulbifer variabilis TaxID=266805 RepID=UPI001CFD461A|nr:hypothetical protein [Microbulbifer variabilis]
MSSCKIFVESSKLVPESATRIFSEILTNNLEVQESKLPVVVVESEQVEPSGCYIEVLCSQTPHRTHKVLQSMAIELDETARKVFQIEEPVGVRIQMVDEDFLLGVN